ncbi:transposase [Streptomyces sp. NBC_00841]|nr:MULTISPECIES: Tn3 family transposase [unclassified Streptomyces]MCX4530204.1 transposase [Streptomyces sp. NBC_01669]WSA04016.1 transposase [Streptomyces sp. NBC_00841]
MQAYREGREDLIDALGLVLNAAVLWTTRLYLDAAVAHLRALPADQREHDVLDEDVARLSSLRRTNLNCLGHYSFRASVPSGAACARCATRPRPVWRRTTSSREADRAS